MLFLPDMKAQTALYADELVAALRAARKRGFARGLMYVEACDSGSMFEGLLHGKDDGIFAVTAAAKSENSYPTYCCDFFRWVGWVLAWMGSWMSRVDFGEVGCPCGHDRGFVNTINSQTNHMHKK